MDFQFSKVIKSDSGKRNAYNTLTEKTFGFSFESWYRNGYWTDSHLPYTLFDGEKAVSNISVNRMELLMQGKIYNCIQLGTIMTDQEYRGRGLSRSLFQEVRKDWEGKCDAIFLFANENALDFYPKLGFHREKQYRFEKKVNQAFGKGKRLSMETSENRELLKRLYDKTNPFSKLQAVNNFGLLMFYGGLFMKDSFYYLEEQEAIVVGDQEEDTFVCYDIFCEKDRDLDAILSAAAPAGTKKARLEFTPNDSEDFKAAAYDDSDDALFVFGGAGGGEEKLLFPLLSHT